jgi:hypothetical protein
MADYRVYLPDLVYVCIFVVDSKKREVTLSIIFESGMAQYYKIECFLNHKGVKLPWHSLQTR